MKSSIQILLALSIIYLSTIGIFTMIESYERQIETLRLQLNHNSCKVDSLERQIDTLIYNRELSKYNVTNEDVLKAIIYVESRNNDSAFAPSENAAGCLQIRPIMVREGNRILKINKSSLKYTLDDRWNRKKSKEIFNIFITYYNFTTAEEIARGWNGGPRGINKSTTISYWGKVKLELNS